MIVVDLRPRPLLTNYMGTALHEDEVLDTFKRRLGQCYFLSALAIVDGDLYDGTLVHGTIHGRGSYNGQPHQRIGHGWVLLAPEPGESAKVWEPITGDVYDKTEWYGYARAREERLYDPTQIRIQLLTTGNFGRWHESEYP